MDTRRNPFAPYAGVYPPELAGRGGIIEMAEVLFDRTRNGFVGKNFIMYGLRGVGKTVLLVKMDQIAAEKGYQVIRLEGDDDRGIRLVLAQELRRILIGMTNSYQKIGKKLYRGLRVLLSYFKMLKLSIGELNIELEPETGVADSGNIAEDISSLLIASAEAAKENGKYIAISIDEIHTLPDEELRGIVVAMHRVQQLNLPLVLYGAGLPTILAKIGKAKTYSERLFDYPKIDALSADEISTALQVPVRNEGAEYTDEALRLIYNKSLGYPYFVQVWGKVTWDIAADRLIDTEDVKNADPIVIKTLDDGFYRVRYDQLTNREKMYLKAMAELGHGAQKSREIAARMKVSPTAVSALRDKLIAKGVIYSPEYTKLAFTVPLFENFVMRHM